jgi:hypothetical protein
MNWASRPIFSAESGGMITRLSAQLPSGRQTGNCETSFQVDIAHFCVKMRLEIDKKALRSANKSAIPVRISQYF